MPNTDVFKTHDIVVSIPERIINKQLAHLQECELVRKQLVISRTADRAKRTWAYKVHAPDEAEAVTNGSDDCLIAVIQPQVTIAESGMTLVFRLAMKSGLFRYSDAFGSTSIKIENWVYAFDVRLNLKEIQEDHARRNLAVPPVVQEKLAKFRNSMFTVQSLFMDFQHNQFATINTAQTETGGNNLAAKELGAFMAFWVGSLKGSDNPFVLGYSITVTDAKRYDDDDKVPDELKPVSAEFMLFADKNRPDYSTLNFVLRTKGGKNISTSKLAPFTENWIGSKEASDGKMVFSNDCLVGSVLIRTLVEKIERQLREKLMKHIPDLPERTYAQAVAEGRKKMTTESRQPIMLEIASYQPDGGSRRYIHTVKISHTNVEGRPACQITLEGNIGLYGCLSKDFGLPPIAQRIDFLRGAHINLGYSWWKALTTWSVTMTVEAKKGLRLTSEKTLSETKIIDGASNLLVGALDTAQKGIAYLVDMSGIAKDVIRTVLDDVCGFGLQAKADFERIPGLGEELFGNLGDISNNMIILPAGQVFYFKNPHLDQGGNFYVDVTYKSDI